MTKLAAMKIKLKCFDLLVEPSQQRGFAFGAGAGGVVPRGGIDHLITAIDKFLGRGKIALDGVGIGADIDSFARKSGVAEHLFQLVSR